MKIFFFILVSTLSFNVLSAEKVQQQVDDFVKARSERDLANVRSAVKQDMKNIQMQEERIRDAYTQVEIENAALRKAQAQFDQDAGVLRQLEDRAKK